MATEKLCTALRRQWIARSDLAIAAYDHSPEIFRLPLENTVENLNRLVESSLERIATIVESEDQAALSDISSRASRNLQRLVEVASAIINGATNTIDKSEIDSMFER